MGRKMQHDFEVYGSKGALVFSQERFNELHFYSAADAAGRRGFRRIEAGPDHPPYGRFCVAPGHQLGFNDLKAIEVARYIDAIAGKTAEPFNFRAGLRIQELVETDPSLLAERRLDAYQLISALPVGKPKMETPQRSLTEEAPVPPRRQRLVHAGRWRLLLQHALITHAMRSGATPLFAFWALWVDPAA